MFLIYKNTTIKSHFYKKIVIEYYKKSDFGFYSITIMQFQIEAWN